ncbi:autophagy-related 33 protein [Rutstroemia sp. NJR-2017a BVV2]|nr:autophagy-related 33 protein [Rutstroemia sp. NJR-2017a BVV2]
MATRSISTLKFVGSISLGLLTGISYTLSSLTIPALLTLPSATVASRSYHSLTTLTTNHIRSLTGISSFAFLLAFYLSPRGQKHPYLLWTSLFAASSSFVDQIVPLISKASPLPRRVAKKNSRQSKRQMDASYEVVGDSNSSSADEEGGSFNGEEVRGEMEGEMMRQVVRTVLTGLGFAMSVVGIWGDGVATEVVFVEVV